MKVYCPECEAACSDQAPFCPQCGHPLFVPPPQQPTKVVYARPPKKQYGLGGLFKLIVALIFGWFVLSCAGICTTTLDDAVNQNTPSTAAKPSRVATADPKKPSRETTTATKTPNVATTPPVKHELQPLTIKVLKTYMASRSHAAIDIRFTNTSDSYINYWAVSVEVYGDRDSYLGTNTVMVDMLRPGDTKVEQLLLLNTDVAKIKRWEARLDGVVGRSGLRIDEQFELKAE